MYGKCAWKECTALDTTFQAHQLGRRLRKGFFMLRPFVPVMKLDFPEGLLRFLIFACYAHINSKKSKAVLVTGREGL
jgi:hypothetical protein